MWHACGAYVWCIRVVHMCGMRVVHMCGVCVRCVNVFVAYCTLLMLNYDFYKANQITVITVHIYCEFETRIVTTVALSTSWMLHISLVNQPFPPGSYLTHGTV